MRQDHAQCANCYEIVWPENPVGFEFMFLLIKGIPSLSICRDGGSIIAMYETVWRREFVLTLPVRWKRISAKEMAIVGYGSPILTQYIKERVKDGISGAYVKTVNNDVPVSTVKALGIVRKILKSVRDAEQARIASDLVRGLEADGSLH